jgi:predicted RNA binding protein YcfA (HicA-like mRNA interferase family)
MKTREVKKYLKQNGFEILRTRGKHNVYFNQQLNRKLTTSKTSSDPMYFKQIMRDVERILGTR